MKYAPNGLFSISSSVAFFARVVYDNILKVSDDPDVNDVIKFLRQREIVHFQRFGEAKRKLTSRKKAHSLRCFAAPIKYKSYDIGAMSR